MQGILFLGCTGIVLIASLISFFALNKESQARNKRIILFLFIFSVVISAGGLVGASGNATGSMMFFFMLQALFCGLGYLASYLLKKDFWGVFENRYSAPLFVLMNAAAGMIGFFFVFKYFAGASLAQFYALSAIIFVMPQFLVTCIREFRDIPQEIYKVWYFPLNADEVDYENIDTSTVWMMELEYSKSVNDDRLTNTKLRAPLGIKFGDWFRSFVEGYNDRNSHDPIHYAFSDSTAMAWIFYVKPSFLGTSRFIDPDLTITQNKLTEKNIIVARRVVVD